MPRQSKTAMDEGFLKACWGEIAEMEDDYKRICVVSLIATTQKGVFSVQMSASALEADMEGRVRQDKLTQRFPNSTSTSFAGFLWSMARRLHDQVAEVEDERKASDKVAG